MFALGAAMLARDLWSAPAPSSTWAWVLFVLLTALCVAGSNFTFLVHGGWHTAAGTVPHLAAAFLLPPGFAELAAILGTLSRQVIIRAPWPRAILNMASVVLSVGVTAHLVDAFGGTDLLRGIPDSDDWVGLLVAILASGTYYLIGVVTVARAASLDRQVPFLELVRARFGLKLVTEVGLGLLGAAMARFLTDSPAWVATLVFPGVLVFLGKQSMDRAERRSRDLQLTGQVGRSVAATVTSADAFRAISSNEVRTSLRLTGMALEPLGSPPAFDVYVATTADLPAMRAGMLDEIRLNRGTVRHTFRSGRIHPSWLTDADVGVGLALAGIPFGGGTERELGALITWRNSENNPEFTDEDLRVLETLADYAAVALHSARLVDEMARMSREAAAAEAMREVEALKAVSRLKDEFLGQVSHELRTPLTIIHGYSELISEGMVDDQETVTRTVREIHGSSALMLRLVDDLLDTSRLETGRLDLQLQTLDLSHWLKQAGRAFGSSSPDHTVSVDVPQVLAAVRVDPTRLGQVLNNLLSNAARYSPAGSEIVLSADVDAEHLTIRVRDQGVGVPEDEQARIFEKFYRGKDGPTLSIRGTGLGLAVAKSLVEAHHGAIGVESKLGEGSTFWVRLPLAHRAGVASSKSRKKSAKLAA